MKSALYFLMKTAKVSVAIILSITSYAQKVSSQTKSQPSVVKSTPSSVNQNKSNGSFFICSWGNKIGEAKAHKEEALQLLKIPFKVKDIKGAEYKVVSYLFSYKRKVQYEEEETKKIITNYKYISGRFYSSPLDKLWIDNVSETLENGEEIRIDDIIVESKGKKVLAGTIVLKIYE